MKILQAIDVNNRLYGLVHNCCTSCALPLKAIDLWMRNTTSVGVFGQFEIKSLYEHTSEHFHHKCSWLKSWNILIWKTQVWNSSSWQLLGVDELTHWGRVTHICVVKLTIIGADNGLSPGRRQAIIWTNAGILLIGPLGTNFIEILIGIQIFSFTKMRLKVSPAKWHPFVSASMC